MLVQPSSTTYTLDEYRILEQTTEFRNEYHDGEILPMTGGTINHDDIAVNLIFLLKTALRRTNYHIQSSNLRLWLPQYRKGLYPDVMVISGEPVFNNNRTDEVLNPCLIIEVLSKSTSSYDRGDKFLYYRSIPEFREYVLVNQSEYKIEHYIKTGENEWLFREYQDSEGKINLESVEVTLETKDIYEGVSLELEE
jgi:Uma2 family endonuclease